jgi:hypothetical protein
MLPPLFYSHLVGLGLLWLCVMRHDVWPSRGVVAPPKPAELSTPPRQCSNEPTPCAGLTHKPQCALGEQAATHAERKHTRQLRHHPGTAPRPCLAGALAARGARPGQAAPEGGGSRLRGALGRRPRDGRLWKAGGEGFHTGLHTLRGVSHTSAARTSPMSPRATSWA